MIKIHLTGTRDELTKALSITRNDYTVLSRSKPHPMSTDPLRWSMSIKAELKPVALDGAAAQISHE